MREFKIGGKTFRANVEFIPGQKGGYYDPSWPDSYDIYEVEFQNFDGEWKDITDFVQEFYTDFIDRINEELLHEDKEY